MCVPSDPTFPLCRCGGELVDAYSVCPRGCDVLLILERMTRSELAIPRACPTGCGANLDVVPTRRIIIL
jgi:hypothetical protein